MYIIKYCMSVHVTCTCAIYMFVYTFKDEGVEFNIQGEMRRLRGTVALGLADNPAAHNLGGYKSLSSAIRKCRQCLAVDEDIQTKVYMQYIQARITVSLQ